jgi:DNA replication protein DnaC
MTTHPIPTPDEQHRLLERVSALKLAGLAEHWEALSDEQLVFISQWLGWEEEARRRGGLERRLGAAHLGKFKPIADFDWSWPAQCDRSAISELMKLEFIAAASNVILVGPNGIGKSTLAQNLAHQALLRGYRALFVTAAKMLGDLAAQDGAAALQRRLRYYAKPDVLVIDELGYLSYSNRHADLLFEIVNRRYELKPVIITTNRPFAEWGEVFPNAPCVVSIIDRLVHHSEILSIDGESYRMHEATERAGKKQRRTANKSAPKPSAKDSNR